MAGSNPSLRYDHAHLCSGIGHTLGGPFWCSNGHVLRQRLSVHLAAMGIHFTAVATSHHCLPPGLVERFHRHLKSALRARLSGPNWLDELPWVLLGIRTAPKEDLGCSSAEWCPTHCSRRFHRQLWSTFIRSQFPASMSARSRHISPGSYLPTRNGTSLCSS